MTTRRQHYVWRHYLRAWATDEKIWCLRDEKKSLTNLVNIGQERDFYAVKDITENDIKYIITMTESRHGGVLNDHNSEFINLYKSVSALRMTESFNEKIKEFLIQFEEDVMCSIEQEGIQYLEMLHMEETGFFTEYSHRAKFSFFIMIQFIRTKRMSEKIKNTMRDHLAKRFVNVESVWSVEKYIDAGHLALSLFSDNMYKIYLLKNDTEIPFITGDQPIFNTYGVGIGDSIPSETEFYYPISPSLAVIISKKEQPISAIVDSVHKYNSFVEEMAYEQIYANEEAFL
ncbi:MAG: DUF4238 domain-containing protein [Thiolinea sp.]